MFMLRPGFSDNLYLSSGEEQKIMFPYLKDK